MKKSSPSSTKLFSDRWSALKDKQQQLHDCHHLYSYNWNTHTDIHHSVLKRCSRVLIDQFVILFPSSLLHTQDWFYERGRATDNLLTDLSRLAIEPFSKRRGPSIYLSDLVEEYREKPESDQTDTKPVRCLQESQSWKSRKISGFDLSKAVVVQFSETATKVDVPWQRKRNVVDIHSFQKRVVVGLPLKETGNRRNTVVWKPPVQRQ